MKRETKSQFVRTILIVEDDEINREILKGIVSPIYNVLEATNGQEALDLLRKNSFKVSLILLDIQMPVMNGYEFLKEARNIERLSSVPIIVTTSEKDDEEKCLEAGASDFVTKPYKPNIILRRIQALIRLTESSIIVNETKLDPLTKLYSKSIFDVASNAVHSKNKGNDSFIQFKIEDFQYINATYGDKDSNNLLKFLGKILAPLNNQSCVIAHYNNDTFSIYFNGNKKDTITLITSIKKRFYKNSPIKNVVLKFAYYLNPNKGLNSIKINERLSNALEIIRHDYLNDIIEFDNNMLIKKNKERFIIDAMSSSLKNEEFKVFLQPKHDAVNGKLVGCEALVRWIHPDIGLISPGEFIPLFEDTGFITNLDKYIVEKTCESINEIARVGIEPLPVSINLSRRDLAIMESTHVIDSILEKNNIPKNLIHLEITESVAAEDVNIIDKAKMLRDSGYQIEIDDFGSGYSSLGIIADIPMDYLKLDMSFARNYLKQKSVIKAMINLAHELNVKTIAEGIENQEQVDFYLSCGVDYIQGYFYSKALPLNEFINYIKKYN